ncbi:MAG: hypothetical protein K1Y36_28785 [Blastocatellia bacterium]|nr:hypothetical protein [Blastocatellia bacterium]
MTGRARLVERFRNLVAVGTGVLVFATLALLLVYELLTRLDPLKVLKITVLAKILFGILGTTALSLYLRSLRKKLAARRTTQSSLSPAGNPTTEFALELPEGNLPSVTEHTTELLPLPQPTPVKRR